MTRAVLHNTGTKTEQVRTEVNMGKMLPADSTTRRPVHHVGNKQQRQRLSPSHLSKHQPLTAHLPAFLTQILWQTRHIRFKSLSF